MTNLTNAQKAVIATPSAMKIIADEAKKAVAIKFNTTVEMVEIALSAGKKNVLSMMAELMATGISEAAKLVK